MSLDNQILTKDEILSAAKQFWNTDITLLDYKISSFSGEKLGFMSLHLSLVVDVEEVETKKKKNASFFLKSLPMADNSLAIAMKDMGVFDREIAFYRQIVPSLGINYQEESWSPNCYGITKNAMILENLCASNFKLPSSKNFTYDEMKALLSAIARMQSASIITEHRMEKPLNEAFPEAFTLEPIIKPNGFYRKWFQAGVNMSIRLAKELGMKTDNIQSTCDRFFQLILPEEGKQNVVTHGDLWSNNIMFNGEKPPKCKLFDFQWNRYCPPAQEVVLVLHYCNDKEFRAKYQDEMFAHYYGEMKRILEKHQVPIFSWDEFLDTARRQIVTAKILMAMCFPSIFMNGDECAEMMNDEKKFTEFMFIDKAPVTMFLYKKGGEYEEKIKQAVIELAEVSQKIESYV